MTSMSDNLLEPEQDANTALTELDKGLRSGKIGEQCEAIVRFPRLFEKYPFPILINSSLLKLADVFRNGSNFLRVWVLRVCQQSEKHLDKILNVDEFVRRIIHVLNSNDPVARALALRTLGAVAGIIAEWQQVHHKIRSSLDSHDAVEVEAAIVAATQFAAQSKKFAISMCNKVSEMIQGLATPSHRKLQLIPILQHMHHDASTASMVRALCGKLLSGYPAEDFLLITLSTLTQLAAATLVDIPQQVTLLVQYLRDDPRWTVKIGALEGLRRLAKEGATLWPEDAVTEIVNVAMTFEGNRAAAALISAALDVLSVVVASPVTCHRHAHGNSHLMAFARQCGLSADTRAAAKAITITAHILCYCYEENLPVSNIDEALRAIEALYLVSSCEPVRLFEVKTCLQALVKFSKSSPLLAERSVLIIASRLFTSDVCNLILCEALGAIGGCTPSALGVILPQLVDKLRAISRLSPAISESQSQTQVMLCTLLFQCQLDHEWDAEVRHAVTMASTCDNNWANFRIGRAAARYGHHDIAHDIFGRLKYAVSTEQLYFWLSSLEELCKGEAALHGEEGIIARLSTALTHHSKALAAIKAASTLTLSMHLQAEYVKCRWELVQALLQLVHACHSLCTAPPPAIAAAAYPYHSRDELQRYGQVTSQLQKSVKEVRNCAEMYQKLYQSAFDADPESLANLQMFQQICLLIANNVDKVCQLGHIEDFALDLNAEHFGLEINYLVKRFQAAQAMADAVLNNKELKPITHVHVNVLIQQAQIFAETALCLPRFYFQTLQSTSLKLNISPQPRVAGESMSVTGGSQLAVKVEGVMVHGSRPGLYRSAANIAVTLQSQLQARQHSHQDVKGCDALTTITQSVAPHRDFFSAQFLLGFPAGGQYAITVEAAIADENGHLWRTGPRTQLAVKCHEENKLASAQTSTRAFAPPRPY